MNYLDCLMTKVLVKSFFEYPYRDEVERKIPNRVRGMAYQGTVKSNPAMTKLVYAVRTAPIVFFYNINEDGDKQKMPICICLSRI